MTVAASDRSGPMRFTYNAFGQIVTMLQGSTPYTYTYDADGNQTTENGGTRLAGIRVWSSSVPMLTGLRQLK